MALTTAQAKDVFANALILEDIYTTEDIIEALQVADDAYHNTSTPIVPDSVYDALRQYAEKAFPDNTYFLGIGSSVRGGKVDLPFKMGSLNQVYEGDTVKWVEKHNLQNEEIVITDKLDGVSCALIYDNTGKLQIAYSRGDGTQGADITRHVVKIPSVPKQLALKGPAKVRAEIIIKIDNFPKMAQHKTRAGVPYKNPRNMVAGLMNSSTNPEGVYQYIDCVAYELLDDVCDKAEQIEILEQCGFLTPYTMVKIGRFLDDTRLTDYLNDRRSLTEYEIDGIVLDVNSQKLRAKINPTKDTLNPEYAVKFKVADASNMAVARVINVEWNISKDGFLKPRVQIEPIELKGVTIQYATGFNARFIYDNKIGPGAKVRISRMGDVIPNIIDVVEPMKF